VVSTKEERHPIGVITDRDIVIRTIGRDLNPLEQRAGDCMTTPCQTVTPETSLVECCAVLEQNQIRRVPVIDDSGRLIGIVALADVVQHAGRRTAAEVVKEVSARGSAKPH
jgi:CBS domain-containing protein